MVHKAVLNDANGNELIHYPKNNLSIVNYSVAVKGWFDFSEIQPHVYFNEKLSTAVPYVTSYYSPNWGICLTKKQYDQLDKTTKYYVEIDDVNFETVH